jgi:D-3-phosphoglycerate dehydrogenase
MMRAGGWDRGAYLGTGLTGKTVGIIGLGNIGRDFLALIAPLGTQNLAFDPYLQDPPAGSDVRLVDLPTLMRQSDVVCIACPLNRETRHLVDAELIAEMKPTSYLVNVSRGGLINEEALIEALRSRSIAGAGLDVFEQEPLPDDSPLRTLENVILAPHSLGWTDELVRGNGTSTCRAVLDVSRGILPRHPLNPQALQHPRQEGRWQETTETERAGR